MLFLCSYLLTCGSDGDVRIYKDFDDSDPESVRAGDNVTILAVKVKTDQQCKMIESNEQIQNERKKTLELNDQALTSRIYP